MCGYRHAIQARIFWLRTQRIKRQFPFRLSFHEIFLTTHLSSVYQKPLRACGWWSLNREKIAKSNADYWVFVLVGFERRSTDFVVIRPAELLTRLDKIHKKCKVIQTYIWVTEKDRCWETRGLKSQDQLEVAQGNYSNIERDLSAYLNNWEPIQALNKMK